MSLMSPTSTISTKHRASRRASRRRRTGLIIGLSAGLILAPSASGFWFICKYRDAQKAAEVARKARERYHEYLSSPTATRAQTEACKQAWDVLRKATFGEIADFATSVPGTTFTGPPNVKRLAKKALQEAIKEVLGEITAMSIEGTPVPFQSFQNGELTTPDGATLACAAFAGIPVEVDEFFISNLELSYISPLDYNGALGAPPLNFHDRTPLVMVSGDFEGVPIDSFMVDSLNPVALAHGGVTVTPQMLSDALLADPTLGQASLTSGFLAPEIVAFINAQNPSWDPFNLVRVDMEQAGTIEITAIDAQSGTVSGRFFSVAGDGASWNAGAYDQQIQIPSERGTGRPDREAADDFELEEGNTFDYEVRFITAELVQDSMFLKNMAVAEIYAETIPGIPDEVPLASLTSVGSHTTGTEFFGGATVHEYLFDAQGLRLPPGRYWLSVVGLGDGTGQDRAYFGSASHPAVRLSQAQFRDPSVGVTQWTPVDQFYGIPTDLAFTVDAEQLTCYADCDGGSGKGELDIFDFLCFQDAFAGGAPYADCDGNGTLDIFDFLCFQDAFAAGCPNP